MEIKPGYNPIITIAKGRYDLCRDKEQWSISVFLPDGTWLNETFDEEPDVDRSSPPSEVVNAIEKRMEQYWISTSREGKRAKIAAIRDNLTQMDSLWAQNKIKALTREIASLMDYITEDDDV